MALGGGTFITQNKILPGSYINFVSTSNASAQLSERGYATMPLELDWGQDNDIFEVTNEDFQKNSLKFFGYSYTHENLRPLRDLFLNVQTLYVYRLNSGTRARNEFATAKHTGVRGNDLKLSIYENLDDSSYFDVTVLWDNQEVESQTVSAMEDLVESDYVDWITTATLTSTAGTPLTGGTNSAGVTGSDHQTYLNKIEPYSFHTMGVVTTDDTVKSLYLAFVKRMRDEVGAKFQLVVHQLSADYEGVINVKNDCTISMTYEEMEELDYEDLEDTEYESLEGDDTSTLSWSKAALVYWVTGLQANCAVNKSCLNQQYDGEFSVSCDYTQSELISAISKGEFVLHQVGSVLRVLCDCNSLVTVTEDKGEIFKENQTIRVCDQIANDIALLFNEKYLGNIANDTAGRISLWTDIVKYYQQLQDIRAIEEFSDSDVVVEQGNSKKSVVVASCITVVNAMAQLYMTVHVS